MLALALVRLLQGQESYESVPRVSILYAVVLALQLVLYGVIGVFQIDAISGIDQFGYMIITIRRIERFGS
jgi:hypothetical protein